MDNGTRVPAPPHPQPVLLQNLLLVRSIATSILGVSALLVRTGHQFGELRSDLAGQRRETALQFAGVDERFRAAETQNALRFDGVDRRLDRVDARLDRVEDRLTSVEVTVARIGQRLGDHLIDPRAHQPAT